MPAVKVPFNRPVRLPAHDTIFAHPDLRSCIAGNGAFTKTVEETLSATLRCPVRLVTSATHAMEMMALLTEIAPGDEVICPSFTFVSTANAFALRGARLRFADNDSFGNILPSEIERLCGPKTKAVIVVHYAGNSANMNEISQLCRQKKILLLEDAAQAVGSFFENKPLGTIGALGCYSFHETKNITSGEGGAFILGDSSYVDRADILREKGTNRAKFFLGLADKYSWVDLGSSYVLSELSAAYLAPQLPAFEQIQKRRSEIWNRYDRELGALMEKAGVETMKTPSYNRANHHLFAGVFPTQAKRDFFIKGMREDGIMCPFHYVSLHTSSFARRFFDGKPDSLPGCERLSERLARFPLFFNLSDADQTYVLEKAAKWLASSAGA